MKKKKNKSKKDIEFTKIEVNYVTGNQAGSITIDNATYLKNGELAVGVLNEHAYFEMPVSEAHVITLAISAAINIFNHIDLNKQN